MTKTDSFVLSDQYYYCH